MQAPGGAPRGRAETRPTETTRRRERIPTTAMITDTAGVCSNLNRSSKSLHYLYPLESIIFKRKLSAHVVARDFFDSAHATPYSQFSMPKFRLWISGIIGYYYCKLFDISTEVKINKLHNN